MANFTTSNSTVPPPSLAAHPHGSGLSPLSAVLCLVALIVLPMISYTFFVAMKCPRNPFRRSAAAPPAEVISCKTEKFELVCGVKYRKAAADGEKGEAGGNDMCPVCLSAFADGEEIRQLSTCKHAFHAACIDMWLYSHSSCPVCRAAVPVLGRSGF